MSNILAALVGGLGAGAQSLGASRMQEQEEQRRNAQRMAELQQQETARLNVVREAASAQAAERARRAASAGAVARTLGIELPEGVDVDPSVVPMLRQGMADRERGQRERDAADRTAANARSTNEAYFNTLRETGRLPKSMTEFNEGVDYKSIFPIQAQERGIEAAQAGRQFTVDNRVTPTPKPEADPNARRDAWVLTRVNDLMDPRGDALDAQSAKAQAERDAAVLFPSSPSSPPPPPRPAPGTNLMQGISGALGGRPSPASFDRRR
jgi:hypothetical protein